MKRKKRWYLLLVLSLLVLLLVGCRRNRGNNAADGGGGGGLLSGPAPTATPIPPTLRPTVTPAVIVELPGLEINASTIEQQRFYTQEEIFARSISEDLTPGQTPTLTIIYNEGDLNEFGEAFVFPRFSQESEFVRSAVFNIRDRRVVVKGLAEDTTRPIVVGVQWQVAAAPNQVEFAIYEIEDLVTDDPPDPVLEQISLEATDFANEFLSSLTFTTDNGIRYRVAQLTFERNKLTITAIPG